MIYTTAINNELRRIYEEASGYIGFPVSYCSQVSKRLVGLGFDIAKGWFLLDYPMFDALYSVERHTWAVDAEGTIIDLTAHQFNSGLINPIKPGVLIVRHESELHARYLPDDIDAGVYAT